MGVFSGPELVTSGLVFGYDSGSVMKSWRGAPATNLFTETNLNNWSKSATVATSSFVAPFDITTYIVEDDNAAAWESIDRNVTVPNDSSSYTLSLFVRKTYGGVSARLGFNSGFNTGGTTVAVNQRFNSDTGVATNGIVIDYGDWWYWYFTITNNSSGNTNLYCSFYPATGPYNSSDASSAVGTAVVGGFMLVAGSTAARFVAGARSNTQALLDMAKLNTITATSLAYASNDTFSFNGTNSDVTGSANAATLGITNNLTISIFTRRTASPTNALQGQAGFGSGGSISIKNSTSYFADINSATPTRYIVHISPAGAGVAIYENVWVNLCVTISGTTVKTFLNGALASTQTMDTTIKSFASEVFGLGAGYGYFRAQADIPVAYVYNRALTDIEVQQNFNSLRGRFGI